MCTDGPMAVDKLIGVFITRVVRIRIGFLRVGRHVHVLNGPEIHWIIDDTGGLGDGSHEKVLRLDRVGTGVDSIDREIALRVVL